MFNSKFLSRNLLLILLATTLTVGSFSKIHAAESGSAPSAIGSPSYQNVARKECMGTANNTISKIWYTVANGVLSDVYAPTLDATNVQSLRFIVTDGKTFTDLQGRDTTYTVTSDPTGMMCTVKTVSKSRGYSISTTYFTDSERATVLMKSKFTPATAISAQYKIYARFDANAGGNGGGSLPKGYNAGGENAGADTSVTDNSSGQAIPVTYDTNTTSNATGRNYAVPSFLALSADQPFSMVSNGFAGTPSDGLKQLDSTKSLSPVYSSATNGNTVQTVGIQRDATNSFTLGLGFGTSQQSAVSTVQATLSKSVDAQISDYSRGWQDYNKQLTPLKSSISGLTSAQLPILRTDYYQSVNVVKASMDKTFPGAIVAGVSVPWGQTTFAGDPRMLFAPGYREVFARDAYEAWTGLFTAGDLKSAQDITKFLLTKSQQKDGTQPRNSLLNGVKAPDAFNTQPDETAYPLIMAWQSGLASDSSLWPKIKLSASYLATNGPTFNGQGVERWEEQTGFSPSTIAAEIAGLVCAAAIATTQNDSTSASKWLATADLWQTKIKAWGVTTNGPLSKSSYFIRLSKNGDPNAAINYDLGNGNIDFFDQRRVMDIGFLEYVRLGVLPASDSVILNSLSVADRSLKRTTSSGPGWLRYTSDGYGDCNAKSSIMTYCNITGQPWTTSYVGTGHPWPLLGVERAQHYLAAGNTANAISLLRGLHNMNSGPGLVPEQIWDASNVPASAFGADPATASIGFISGKATGSASPLTWASAAQVRLIANINAGKNLEMPQIVFNRYAGKAR